MQKINFLKDALEMLKFSTLNKIVYNLINPNWYYLSNIFHNLTTTFKKLSKEKKIDTTKNLYYNSPPFIKSLMV